MSPSIAIVVFAFGILGLFVLDRDRTARTSKALWIPVVWLSIIGSRPVSAWLGGAPSYVSVDQYVEGSPLDAAVYAILIIAGLVVLARRGQRVTALLRRNRPILWFFLYCTISIMWSDFPVVASKRLIKFYGDLEMILIVLTDPDPSAAVRRFLAWAGFLLLPLSVLLIKYYPSLGGGYLPWSYMRTWTGVALQKNDLGMICMIFGLASLWRLLLEFQERGRRKVGPLIAHGVVLATALWLFKMANSATSWSTFVLTAGLLAVMARPALRVRRPAIVHLLAAAIVFFSAAVVFFDFGGGVGLVGRDPTLTGRRVIWSVVLSMAQNPLLGTGFESFWLGDRLKRMWALYNWFPNQAHNGYIEVYVNLGWIGVALLAVLLVTSYRNVFAAYRRDPRTGSLMFIYVVAAIVYNLTEAAFKMQHPMWDVFLLVSTAVAALPVGEAANAPGRARAQPSWRRADLPGVDARVYGEGS